MSRSRFLAVAACGLLLLALTGIGVALQQRYDTDRFIALAFAQGAVYLLAVGLLWRMRSAGAIAVVLAVAAAMRVVVVLVPPYLSSDVYRYVWDGRVIAAGINPYRYIPADPHLAALRDSAIFPNINRANYAHTIYPPAAEAIFYAVTRVSENPIAMKGAMVVFEAIAVTLLLRLLTVLGQPPTRIVVYAWHPMPLWEFAGSGHVDAAVVALVALALLIRQRPGKAGGFTGLVLAAATLTKFYPVTIFPALWQRWDWRMPVVFAATAVLAYLPFLGVGWRVFGFLPHYVVEEGFTGGGSGFYLWNIARSALPLGGVSETAYLAIAAAILAGLAGFVALRPRRAQDDVRAAALLAGAFMLLLSPHYPWYFAWLVVFACVEPSAALVWLTLASFLLYLVPVWPHPVWNERSFIVDSALYAPFLALAAWDLRRHRRREQA